MEESSMFIQWAMNTLLDEPPSAPPAIDDGCRGQPTFQPLPQPPAFYAAETTTMDHDACLPLPNSSWHALTGGGSNNHLAVSWMNFSGGDGMPETSTTMTTRGLPQPPAYGGSMPPPMRRAGVRNTGSSSSSWQHAPTGGGSNNLAVSWMNFSGGDGMPETSTTMTTQRGLLPQPAAYGSSLPPPMRRAAGVKNTGSSSSTSPATYAHEHIIAERKRREKISQRFVELSAVIPGLKKMDKATILSDATRYVKELQEKLRAREAAGGGVIISRSSSGGNNVPALSPLGASSTGTKPLPEIEAQLCGDKVIVRVLCQNGKGVVAKVLAENR
ncbi:hypothetical protein HU200_034902 [Digitaria exilis]|uniref:BHLH domain-containing protein n=1 Tax=Digitaria exilis TaxID=1010633 RepID=A0A835BNX1_9POAL|nr:hypothetical protein HU200_034902 [Digitaria exilis]